MNPLANIPTKARAAIYSTYVTVGIFLGACQVAEVDDLGPVTVMTALAVFGYLGTALGMTAVSNLAGQRSKAAVQVTLTGSDLHQRGLPDRITEIEQRHVRGRK